ncbi:hypothetical protein F4604DRAFT_1919333 [Suillus subluteus]|nr:hypothetical protein F4604DRAFT_1919333 [Suillus subluteus]
MTGRVADPDKKNRRRTNAALERFGGDSRHSHFSGERWHCDARSLSMRQGIGVLALKILSLSTRRRFAFIGESYSANFVFGVVQGRSASVKVLLDRQLPPLCLRGWSGVSLASRSVPGPTLGYDHADIS